MMTNLLHGAHVANKLFSTIARLRLLLVMFLTLTASTAWGQTTTTYTFSSKSWAASPANWTSGKDGNQMQSGRGIQVTTGANGANATSPKSFTNVSKIVVTYSTNASAGAGTIKIKIGSNTEVSQNVTKTGGTTDRTLTYNFNPNQTGSVKVTVTCSTNSIYLKSIAITEAAASCTTPPTVSSASNSNITSTTATVSCPNGITSLGSAGCSIESYGFVYGTSSNPTISNTKEQVGTTYTTTGTAFSKGLTGLTANTTYYVRPYATNGNGTAYGTQTSFKTLELPKYTVTLNAGSGTCEASVTEISAGAGVALPTPTICDGWTFAGWTTSAVATETSSKPATLLTGTYKPTSDITLYAVYKRTEEGEGGGSTPTEVSKTYTFSDYEVGTQYAEETYELDGDVTINITGCHINTQLRVYGAQPGIVISEELPGRIVSMGFNMGYKADALVVYGSTNGSSWTEVGSISTTTSYKDYTLDFGETNYTYFKLNVEGSSQIRIAKMSITYESTSGGGSSSTTYYHSTPDCGTTEPTVYTITYNTNGGDKIAATSGTALPNPLPTPIREHYTFVGWYTDESCTQAATAGATIDAAITLYAKWEATMYTVTLNPNYPAGKTGVFKDKEGNTIAGNIEVSLQSGTASQALTNFYSSIELDNYAFDGFYTQAEGGSKRVNTGDITGNITFYAHWKEKYTITWSVNGNTALIEPTTFAAGDNTWEMPTTDYDCSGKEFVGWTTNPIIAAQDEAPDPLYTNASQFPNATATYYAVFAENTGGGGSGGYEKLTAALDDYSGEYLIVYEDGSVAFNGGLSTLDATSNNISVTITEGVIASNATTDAAKFTFAKVDGGYSILSASGKYIGREAESNGLNTSSTYAAGYLNTITYNSITGKGGCTLKYNSANDQNRFRYFTSGQKAIALYKKTGGSATYTGYTTSCVTTYSITYDLNGGSYGCSSTIVEEGGSHTICNETPEKTGHTFTGWKYNDTETIYQADHEFTNITTDITLTAVWQPKTYTVTWSNNGEETGVPYNHGVALDVPEAPESCDDVKEFVGWTTHSGYYHATTAPDDIFTTKTTPVTATATYYAVFATPPTTGGGSSIETTDDVLTRETTGVASGSTNYASWSGKTATSSAIYAGNSAGSNNAIQLRSNNSNSGIVTTTSGGKATRVEVDWESNTASDRTLDIYGRNVAYSAATDLYSTSTQGTKLGSIVYGTSTELEITGDYEYIGLRSNSGAMYLTSVTITWSSAGGSSSHTDYTTTCQEVTGIAISGSYPTTFVQYDSFSFAGGIVTATFENGATQDVTSLATFSGYNMDEVGVQTVTVTYMGQTAKYEITINQSDRWRLTWNVSGKTNTGASPIYVQKGNAIGTLPVPEVPAACAGKTFMGWTESNIVPSDGKGIVYITEGTVPSKNTTYYAVFATINNFSVQKPIEDIESGSNVVIVAVASLTDDGGSGKAISSRATDDTYNLQGDSVAIYDQTINTPHSTCIWKITKSGEKYIFTQDGKYLNAIYDDGHYNLRYSNTQDTWTITDVDGMVNTYRMQSTVTNYFAEFFKGKFTLYYEANDKGDFDMQFYVTANANGEADITDYTTGCAEYTITYYGFHGGYSTSCSSDGTIVLPVNSIHTIPDCEGLVINDHTNLGREFLNVWMTQPHGGHTFKPGDTFILTQDTTLYAQWKMETTSDVTTLPTDIEDLAGTDIYVYGGKTLNIQPGTTTINSLTLKGGLQADGSYKMPTVWVPEGATLVRNSNKIYLDLVVNAKNYYPFAVPFRAKNGSAKANWDYVGYIDPVLKEAATYRTHFVIKTYDGAKRADKGENRDANWAIVNRDTYLEPGVGYMITAMTYAGKDTVTMRIPMTVPNTWFKNGEQAEVGTTVRNTIAVTAHAGEAATEHQRHAGWNFVANPYLTSFTGGNVVNDGGLAYINGELIIEGSYEYTDEEVPYVTIPAYDFAYYSQHKLSDVKLSPEWSFFVQVGTDGTMNFTTAGRQQAPAHLAARAAEQPIKMDVDITLSDDNHSDQTGLIICDRFSDAYEIGHDLEKLFGSAYNLSVYTLMADNTPLAFQALAIQNSMQVIPVGYRTPAQGEYTFALNEATSDIELLNEQYEQLILVDYETGALTNMLNNEYTFYSDRTQSNNRFALYAILRQNTTTDLPNTIGNEEVKKVIYNDHFYILRDGKVFNGAGQIVK